MSTIKSENTNKEHPDLVCPACGSSIAWWNEYVDAYMCSSDWNGADVRGKPRPCRVCSQSDNRIPLNDFEVEYLTSREIGANKH